MNCQVSYKSMNQKLKYIPEIAFSMLEGFGVFNFGAGLRSNMPLGKSLIINDLLFPASELYHEAFELQDRNLFSAGQIDVFFEKSFDKKRSIVMMDGQGSLKDQAILSTLVLTNIVILHFQNQDFKVDKSITDLIEKVKMIKQTKNQIKIILLIRDASESSILKSSTDQGNDKAISQIYPQAIHIENDIDFCVQIINLGSINRKQDRIQPMKVLCKLFYELIDDMNKNQLEFNFTKDNFLNKFIKYDQNDQQAANTIKNVLEQSKIFIKQVESIQNNIFQNNALPVLDFKNKLRSTLLEIRERKVLNDIEQQKIIEDQLDEKLKYYQTQISEQIPSKILEQFKDIVIDKNNCMILTEISKMLRILTQQNIQDPLKRKCQLIELQQNESKSKQNDSKEEIDKRNNYYKIDIDKINIEIYQKSISLEYFWRSLIFYLGKEPKFQTFNQVNKTDIIQSIERQLKNGDCFELIDGENLEFKGLFIQEVIKQSKKDKVIVVCVIGPQSTGKSTLMNFAFGTQFFTSAGRCTKGIYFTLQKISDHASIRWLLMLDTEGLQSPERIDDEYDRKIVLFAMLSADVLIINSRGEINASMINTLKICCVTYDALKKIGYCPEIIYTNGQNDRKDKAPFIGQVQNIKQQVIEASDSSSIERVAEQLLGYKDDKINVFGYAYKNEIIEMDNEKGFKENVNFKTSVTNFGVETSIILKIIQKYMNDQTKGFREIGLWLEESRENWNTIDRYSASINKFQNLEEYRNDIKVQTFLNEEWKKYLEKYSIIEKDEIKCNSEIQKLIEVFQKFGQESLDQEINTIEFNNIREKDLHLEQYIFIPFDQWKQEPLQKGITVQSEKTHKTNMRAKMDVIQNEFKIKLRSKVREEQMYLINQNGHRKVLNRAYQLSNDENFKSQDKQQKNKILQEEFDEAWKQSLEEIKGEAQLTQMKRSYFDDLQKTFKICNNFIINLGEKEFSNLLQKVEQNNLNSNFQQNMVEMLKRELTNTNQNDSDILKECFIYDNEILLQMVEDPKERLYDDANKPEEFLKLKELLDCDYHYTICADLRQDLKQELLINEMLKNMTQMKQKLIKKQRNSFYGAYQEQIMVWVEDEDSQKSYLMLLIQDLILAGFVILNKQMNEDDLSKFDVEQIFLQFYSNSYQSTLKDEKFNWINKFVTNLRFKPKPKKPIQLVPRIQMFFKSNQIIIQNQGNPLIPLDKHKKDNQELQSALIVSNIQIIYKPTTNFSETQISKAIQILIAPKKSQYDAVKKWTSLSYIAFRQLNWELIVTKIMESVEDILYANQNQDNQIVQNEQASDTQEININNIMKLTQMTYEQIKKLETLHLGTNLKEKINNELYQKMGLYMNKILDAKISWCALIYSWVKLYSKAQLTFDIQFNQLEAQKVKYYKQFQEIVCGNTELLTLQSIKTIMSEINRKYIENMKLLYQEQAQKQLLNVSKAFNTIQVYEDLDKLYLNVTQNNYNNKNLQYVLNPVQIFRDNAVDLKNKNIDIIIKQLSRTVQNEIKSNMTLLLKILSKIKNVIAKQNNKNWNQIGNYFKIKNLNENQPLSFDQLQQIHNNISPVINNILRDLIQGKFQMNEFQYKIRDENKVDKDYIFQPKTIIEQGPLETLNDKNLLSDINDILQQNQANKKLFDQVVKILHLNQYEKNCKMFQLDVIVNEMHLRIDDMLNKINLDEDYDEKWFGCQEQIQKLIDQAIGCESLCTFCGRKCELVKHTPHECDHTCEKVGHQMRVFKGGCFINDKGIVFPSLKTCDMIKPDTIMYIDDEKNTWQDILDKQIVKWKVSYKRDDQNLQQKYEVFNKFWNYVGKEICKQKNYQYISKNDQLDETTQMQESGVVVIAIDESGSMSGSRWNNATRGAKQLIEYIKQHHKNINSIRLVIIFFDDNSRVVHDEDLIKQIPNNIWEPKFGGTDFGKPLQDAISRIQKYISTKDTAKLYFFTDGYAKYPKEILDSIEQTIISNKSEWKQKYGNNSKFECLLMCENKFNAQMELIKNKFNQISQENFNNYECCNLMEAVDTSQLGSVMIENFKFK